MIENDVQLIRRVLSGDDSAFATLVEKHQKGVHALIWRKIGDFHYAEEITQDTFVQAYRKLATLRDHNHFSGWLYVIANRLSLNWIQRHKPAMQSLEDIPVEEIEESSYKHYMTEKLETEAAEHRSEVAKELLETLPESERTVVTLYYLGEMTAKEIGRFLGVSVNTIKSRLRRGRERLQKSEPVVHEMLGGLPLSGNLTARVMREVSDITPVAPPAGKPLVPWAAIGAAAVVIVMLLGAGNQYLSHFQRPYSFDAKSKPTIEIVETPIVLDIISKPSIRRQFGRTSVAGRNTRNGSQISEATLRSNAETDSLEFSTTQWMQTNSPPGGHVRDIFTTSEGTVYAVSPTGIYQLMEDTIAWSRVNTSLRITESLMPMAESHGTLYIISDNEILASADKGETWNTFCQRPRGNAIGLIMTDPHTTRGVKADLTMYLALRDNGVFRSTNAGKQWEPLTDGLIAERITAIAAVENSVFAGTNLGLYRLDSNMWKKLAVGVSETIYSLTVSEKGLYVGMGPNLSESISIDTEQLLKNDQRGASRIYHSSDLGASWTDITPKTEPNSIGLPSGIKILAVGETLLALGGTSFRSTDGGKNWTSLGFDANAFMLNSIPSVAVNETTFYKVGAFGIHRTTDAGESWNPFMDGVIGTRIKDLITFNNRLYAYNGYEVFQSIDGGSSWKSVPVSSEKITSESPKQNESFNFHYNSKLLVSDNILYLLSPAENDLRVYGLSADGDTLIPIQEVPVLDREAFCDKEIDSSEAPLHPIAARLKADALAMSHDVFYVEYKRRLIKWKLGDQEWKNTGFADLSQQSEGNLEKGFELAVSGEIIYVGKRDGKLFASLDGGTHWKDVTPHLPLRFTSFKEITFVGSTVYVATDNGVLISGTGSDWRVITDTANNRIAISQFAIAGYMVYGINDLGVYRLDTRGRWEQISKAIPDEVISLAVFNNGLYGATQQRGMFRLLLEPAY